MGIEDEVENMLSRMKSYRQTQTKPAPVVLVPAQEEPAMIHEKTVTVGTDEPAVAATIEEPAMVMPVAEDLATAPAVEDPVTIVASEEPVTMVAAEDPTMAPIPEIVSEGTPPAPPAPPVDVAIAPPTVGVPAEITKGKEVVRRPPLPSASLFEAYSPKPSPMVRRPVITTDDSPKPLPQTAAPDDLRVARSEMLSVSRTDAVAAMEAWSAMSPRRKPTKNTP